MCIEKRSTIAYSKNRQHNEPLVASNPTPSDPPVVRARTFVQAALIGAITALAFACSPAPTGKGDGDRAPTSDALERSAPLVAVHGGTLRGDWAEAATGIAVFKGVPFAAPPIGERRFKPPEAYRSSFGEHAATAFGAACTQPTELEMWVWSRGVFAVSEDCLFLNVWAELEPAETEPRPVMVWFHGGGHRSGNGADRIFDGTNLARRGVVLVTVNYRLGPWGFLAHPELSAESSHGSSGNYGLLDKIAALNWVRDNIGEFGGDPTNVTIFGQSAGSTSVCAIMASPLARGLFHKVIGQSASCVVALGSSPADDTAGLKRGAALVEALPAAVSGDGALAALRAARAEDIVTAADASGWSEHTRITVDGWVLPRPAVEIFAAGEQARVPILVGSLANEGEQLFPKNDALTSAGLAAFAEAAFDDQARAVLDAYADQAAISPGTALWAIQTDQRMTLGMRRWAGLHARAGNPAYLYFMDHEPPVFRLYVPDNPDLGLPPRSGGAYHSGDLAFVFDNTRLVGLGWSDADHQLADTMAAYWTNFARAGDPNGPGLPTWPAYDTESHTTQLLNPNIETIEGARRHKLDLMDAASVR